MCGSGLLVWCSFGQVVMAGGAVLLSVWSMSVRRRREVWERSAFAVLPLLVALAGRSRSGGVRTRCRGGPGATSARRRVSRLSRSMGLLRSDLGPVFAGRAANAVRSGSEELIQGVVLNTWSESAAVMVCSNVCRGRR